MWAPLIRLKSRPSVPNQPQISSAPNPVRPYVPNSSVRPKSPYVEDHVKRLDLPRSASSLSRWFSLSDDRSFSEFPAWVAASFILRRTEEVGKRRTGEYEEVVAKLKLIGCSASHWQNWGFFVLGLRVKFSLAGKKIPLSARTKLKLFPIKNSWSQTEWYELEGNYVGANV